MSRSRFRTGFVSLSVLFYLASSAFSASIAQGGSKSGYQNFSFLKPDHLFWSVFHIDAWQALAATGKVAVNFDWVVGNTPRDANRVGGLAIALTGYRLSRWNLDAVAGDSQFRFTNLRERFSNAFYLDVYVRGGHVALAGPKGELSVFGGRVTRLEGLTGLTYAVTGESLFGFKARQLLGNAVVLGAGFLRTQNEDDFQGAPVTKNNNILLLDSEASLTRRLTWITEFRMSDYQDAAADTRTRDLNLRFGTVYASEKVRFEANYRYAGADYHFVNATTQNERNQQELFFLANASPWKWLTVYGHFGLAADSGRSGFAFLPVQETRNLIGVSISPGHGPTFLINYDSFDRRPNPNVSASVTADFSMSSLYGEMHYGGARGNAYLRFRRFTYADRLYPQNASEQSVATLGLHRSVGSGLIVYAEGEATRTTHAGGGRDTMVTARMGFNYYLDSVFSCWAEGSYSRFSGLAGLPDRNYAAAFVGLNGTLPKGIQVFLDVRYDQSFRTLENLISPPGLRFNVRVMKRFNWGETPRVAGFKSDLADGGTGSISGSVFEDVNGNGLRDPGERGLAKFALHLEDGTAVETAADGAFKIHRVAVGDHLVSLDASHIPIEYNVLGLAEKKVNVAFRGESRLNFRVVSGARLSGRVVLDENKNGKADEKEPGLPDILVYLSPDGEINTFTNADGNFEFQNLNPGEYVIKVDDLTFPSGTALVEPGGFTKTIKAGENAENVVFLVQEKIRYIRFDIGPEPAAAKPPKAPIPGAAGTPNTIRRTPL